MHLTHEMIGVMMPGPDMNEAVEAVVFKKIPLTDAEWQLMKMAFRFVNGIEYRTRLFKVPLTKPDPETGAMYKLTWPQEFSTYRQASIYLVDHMREAGWRFSLRDTQVDNKTLKVASFEKEIMKQADMRFYGSGTAETDEVAICRAALRAAIDIERISLV